MTQTQAANNQHYVPQGYLKEFTYDGKRLYVFDKFTQRWNSRSTKSTASTPHFHDFDASIMQDFYDDLAAYGYSWKDKEIVKRAIDPQLVEHEFANNIEPAFYRARDELINTAMTTGRITQEQKAAMAYFMTMQILRTPETRRTAIALEEQTLTKLVENEGFYVKHDERYAPLLHAQIIFSPEIQQQHVYAFCDHIWIVGKTQLSLPFHTSDTPLVMVGHSALSKEIGIGVYGVEIAYPLTKEYILILLDKGLFQNVASSDCTVHMFDPEKVNKYNRLQALRSYCQIYSSSNDFELVQQMCRRFPKICDPNRSYGQTRWLSSDKTILHSRNPDPDRAKSEVH